MIIGLSKTASLLKKQCAVAPLLEIKLLLECGMVAPS
jgi:hypothetical protein